MAKAVETHTKARAALRKLIDSGATQMRIADAIGAKQCSISSWLTGRVRPEPHYRAALDRLFGIPADAWMTARERRVAFGAPLRRVRAAS